MGGLECVLVVVYIKSSSNCYRSALIPSPSPRGRREPEFQIPLPGGEGFRVRAVRQRLVYLFFIEHQTKIRELQAECEAVLSVVAMTIANPI